MTITIDELIAFDILECIAIVELIDMTRLSRDTHLSYIKEHSQSHLVSVDLQLSTRKVVFFSGWLIADFYY